MDDKACHIHCIIKAAVSTLARLGVKVLNSHMYPRKKSLLLKEIKHFSVHVTDGSNYQTNHQCVKSCTLSKKYENEKKHDSARHISASVSL